MRIFVTGSTGAIGRLLVPRLVMAGHQVVALARSVERAGVLAGSGAELAIADPLDREALAAAVMAARPEAIIHQLTALSGTIDFRKFDRDFALTNRFRTEVTETLIGTGRRLGIRRLIVQSYCGWPFAREGTALKTEEDPLDPDPPAAFRQTLGAIQRMESAVRDAVDIGAMALRYGFFYGPGTAIAADGAIVQLIRKRKMPIVGDGGGIWSFLHIEDAVGATVAAVSQGRPGIYNVVDDEPAPVAEWLPYLAAVLGARPPRKVPVWLARLLIGEGGVSMMTRIRGGSNAKARRELQWQPLYPAWRRGFVDGLA